MKPTCSYYNELRRAIIDYISNEATMPERADAYRIILYHIRAGSLADDDYHDALQADYDATIADFEAGTGRR